MGNPSAVETIAGLAKFVVANLSQRNLVYLGVSTAWDEGGHSAYGVGTSPVAGLDQEIRVSTHKGHGHRDLGPVRQDGLAVVTEGLDDAEDEIPATGVEAGRMVSEFVKNLFHLKCGQDRLNEDGCFDRSLADSHLILGEYEHVVP